MNVRYTVVMIGLSLVTSVYTQNLEKKDEKEAITKKRNSKRDGIDPQTQAILSHFASAVMSFFNILQNPKDPDHVTEQMAGMVNGAVNMIVEAVKSGEIQLDATPKDIEQYVIKKMALTLEPQLKKLRL